MSSFDKIRIQAELSSPHAITATEKLYNEMYPESSQIWLVSKNPWRPQLAGKLGEEAETAIQAMLEGDVSTAKAMAHRVLSSEPSYIFCRTVLLEALDQEGADTVTKLEQTFRAIQEAELVLAGAMPPPSSVQPLVDQACLFEISRHQYNVGDEYMNMFHESGDPNRARTAAAYFSMSIAALPELPQPEMMADSLVSRLVRVSSSLAHAKDLARASAYLNQALQLSPDKTRNYISLSKDHEVLQQL